MKYTYYNLRKVSFRLFVVIIKGYKVTNNFTAVDSYVASFFLAGGSNIVDRLSLY